MKKHKGLIILAVVFLLLVAVYFGISQYLSAAEERQADAEEANKIYVTNITGITKISYTDGQDSFSFTKTDNNWSYDGDSAFPLDDSYVTYMESELEKIEAVRKLENTEELSSYGLDNPMYIIHITDAEGTVTDINIGNTAGENYYLTIDKSTIYTVDSTVIDSLVWDLNSMVLMDTFPTISNGNLVSMEITEGGNITTFNTENNEEEISVCAGGLGAIEVSNMIAYGITEDSAQAEYGLDSGNRITATATYTEEDEEKTVTLYIGTKDEAEENYYIQIEGSGIVYAENVDVVNNILNK